MFDGSFRSKRTINLGGRSTAAAANKDRAALLRQAQEERRAREEERARQSSARRIQALFRSHAARMRWRAGQRAAWDAAVNSGPPADWVALLRVLAFFFDHTVPGDVQRLATLVSNAPANAYDFCSVMASSPAPALVEYLALAARLDAQRWTQHLLPVPDLVKRVPLAGHLPAEHVVALLPHISAQSGTPERLGHLILNYLQLASPFLANPRVAAPTLLALGNQSAGSEVLRRVLGTDAVRHVLLEPRTLQALFEVITHDAIPRDTLAAFCAVIAPALPHLSLTRSPFAALTRPGLLARLHAYAMDTIPGDVGVSRTTAAAETAARNPAHMAAAFVFADSLYRVCSAAGDDEFYAFAWIPRLALLDAVQYLLWLTFAVMNNSGSNNPHAPAIDPAVLTTFLRLLQHLFDRDSRRRFTPAADFWWLPAASTAVFVQQAIAEMPPAGDYGLLVARDGDSSDDDDDEELDAVAATDAAASAARAAALAAREAALSPRHRILRDLPFVLPFDDRVNLFRTFVALDREATGNASDVLLSERQKLTIRRDHIFEDGYAMLNGLGSMLKGRLGITFVSELGMQEAGIDGGGVFKEFFTLLSKEAFSDDARLFASAATADRAQYPRPDATRADDLRRFEFLGRIVGKALYDGLLVDVAFAPFFLNHWLQRRNLFDDLPSLDPQLYSSLVFLKTYTGNVEEDLALNFTATVDDGGRSRTIELIRGGAQVPVTAANRIKYVYQVANFKLNTSIHRQCAAFLHGLSELVRPEWLRLFSQVELGNLMSGAAVAIDLDDMYEHTVYGGEYSRQHPVIRVFWEVVRGFEEEDRRHLVRFITSCNRAPLLGFKELVPKLCIRPGGSDQEWLPTSSTCVNLLKLPKYQDKATLREKLLYSIRSGIGFELS
ncbi:ubiquitin-protein ligase (E3) [Blastocladiella emersonii ATCC 22665]|nr:ubiquitin-protein ligase (E3) [Blastocladiella emersonii ATCC 22665]